MTIISNIAASPSTQVTPLTPASSPSSSAGGLSFSDLLDTVNPLQHIPVLSGLYRAATGSTISTAAKLTGDTLYGLALGGGALISGAVGAASSAADVAVKAVSGTDITGHIVNTVSGVTTSSTNTVPLVPDPNASMVTANAQPGTPSSNPMAPVFFPMDHHPAVTAAQYHHAQIMDTVNKSLVKMTS